MKCENCKYFVDTSMTTQEGTEYDGFCLIKGSDIDSCCKLIPPLRHLLGWIGTKRQDYDYERQDVEYVKYSIKQQAETDKLEGLIKDYVYNGDLYIKYSGGKIIPIDPNTFFDSIYDVKREYDDFAHPTIRKTLRQEWRELILKTLNKWIDPLKPFLFHKKKER